MKMLKYYLLQRASYEPGFNVKWAVAEWAWFWAKYHDQCCNHHPKPCVLCARDTIEKVMATHRRIHSERCANAAFGGAEHAISNLTQWRGYARALTALRNLP